MAKALSDNVSAAESRSPGNGEPVANPAFVRPEPAPVEPAYPARPSPMHSQFDDRFDAERPSRWWVWLIVLALLAVAAYFLVPRLLHARSQSAAGGATKGGGPGSRPVPVVTAVARK